MTTQTDTRPEPLATSADFCDHVGITEAHAAQLRYTGRGPRFIKLTGRQVRYRWSDITEWVESRTRTQTNGAAVADPLPRAPGSRRSGRSERRAATAEPRNGGGGAK